MRKIKVFRTFSASFFIACALNYFAAFNMVGWNFLIPGTYTFGIACTIFLIMISSTALLWIAVSAPVDIVLAGGGLVLAILVISSLIIAEAIQLKDYFIWGFVVAVPVAVSAAALLVHLRHSVRCIRVSRGLFRAAALWALTLVVYGIGVLLNVMPDLQRFHRQQIYLLGVAAITSAVLLQISKVLSSKMSEDKL